MPKRILFLLSLVLLTSCVPKKKLVYFQDIAEQQGKAKVDYEPTLQSDDLLLIIVSAPDPETVAAYNLYTYTTTEGDRVSSVPRFQTYLIDARGEIQFPVIGNIKLGGLTKTQAIEKLKSELKKYIVDPIVNLRITNFKFSVMGEVARPGLFNVATERITLPEALSNAGDMTVYSDRKSVLLIREEGGVKTSTFIDMTSADFINSPYYYLRQNDVVYVQPNKTKINSSAVGPNITVGLSALSLVVTIIALTLR